MWGIPTKGGGGQLFRVLFYMWHAEYNGAELMRDLFSMSAFMISEIYSYSYTENCQRHSL